MNTYSDGTVTLCQGRWETVLADVESVDAVISDPPYSPRAHLGFRSHDDMVAAQRRALLARRRAGKRERGYTRTLFTDEQRPEPEQLDLDGSAA